MRERLKRVGKYSVDALKHLLLGALAVGVLFLAIQGLAPAAATERGASSPVEVYQRWMSGLHKLNVRDAVDTFYWEKGRLPADLDELAREGMLHGTDLAFPWGETFLYETYASGVEEGFFLFDPMR